MQHCSNTGEGCHFICYGKRWVAEFKHGKESLEDDPTPTSGGSVTLATPEIVT